MINHMLIVTLFKTLYNICKNHYEIQGIGDVCCPYCDHVLKYRNSRLRNLLNELGEKTAYLLRRLWCDGCKHLHTEIPDFIQPYKQYGSSVIQEVLDGGGSTCAADDSTIRRWRRDFKEAKADIEQRLKSIYARETDSHVPVTMGTKTLDGLIRREPRWLSVVMKLLICRGHMLCTRFAFCPGPDTLKIDIKIRSNGKGDVFYDKSKEGPG